MAQEYDADKLQEKYDRMIGSFKSIEFDKITVLTGNNGSGKSLIRKQLPFWYAKTFDIDVKDTKGKIRSTSMDARTGSNPEWGGMSGAMRDTEWFATSQNTFSSLKGLMDSIKGDSKCEYLVIDEFEIGCGEETVLAFIEYINTRLKELIATTSLTGALIITHSRLAVQHLECDKFTNIEGMTKEEWLNRKLVPTDLEELDKNDFFLFIRDINSKK